MRIERIEVRGLGPFAHAEFTFEQTETERARAAFTIRALGLNDGKRPHLRKKELDHFRHLSPAEQLSENVADWSYRFLIADELEA